MEIRKTTKTILSRNFEVETFVAIDGREFSSRTECLNYEKQLKFNEIKVFEMSCLYPFYGTFYYADSYETLIFLVNELGNGKMKASDGELLVVGDWVSFYCDYNPNGVDSYYITTPNEIYGQLPLMITRGINKK